MINGNPQDFSASEMLHLFADGELDHSHEGHLFSALASDSELRRELREIVTMRSALRNDAYRLLPSEVVHASLFGAVDLELGLVKAPTAGLMQSVKQFLASGFARVAIPLATTAVGVVIGSGVFSSNAAKDIAQQGGSPSAVSTGQTARTTTNTTSPTLPNTTSEATELHGSDQTAGPSASTNNLRNADGADGSLREQLAAIAPSRAITSTRSASRLSESRVRTNSRTNQSLQSRENPTPLQSGTDGLNNSAALRVAAAAVVATDSSRVPKAIEHASPTVSTLLPIASAELAPEGLAPIRQSVDSAESVDFSSVNVDAIRPSLASVYRGFALQVRGFNGTSLPKESIESNATPMFDNGSMGLYYIISANHRVGLEVGQESFSQSFHGEVNGHPAHYEQNPHTIWYGASYRYQMDRIDFLLGIAPTAQITLGGSGLGGVAREFIGVDIAPLEGISLLAGIDAGTLLYRSGGRWFSTQKLGFTYGATVRF